MKKFLLSHFPKSIVALILALMYMILGLMGMLALLSPMWIDLLLTGDSATGAIIVFVIIGILGVAAIIYNGLD